jgi:outer membrane protein OmpA-like peptidoglycan-associated protein
MLCVHLATALVLSAPPPKPEPVDALDFDQGTLLIEDSGSYGSGLGGWSAWRLADGDPGVGWCSPRDTVTGRFTWQFDGTWKLDTLVLDNTSNEEGGYPGISAKGVELWLKAPGKDFEKVAVVVVPQSKKVSFPLKGKLATAARLVVTGNYGNAEYTELAEVDLLGTRVTPASTRTLSGLYSSNWGPMRFVQEGSNVYGCYDWNGVTYFFGSVSGPIARLSWVDEPEGGGEPSTGSTTFSLKDDGSFWGIYFNSNGGEPVGLWEGSKGTEAPKCTPRKSGAVERALVKEGRVVLFGIRFASNSDVPLPESVPVMDELSATLKANPAMKVLLEGHTDSTNTAAYNLDLSARRAKAVLSYLVKQGLDAGRLSSKGFGLDKPIASNATAQGRSLNRRVEVSVVK